MTKAILLGGILFTGIFLGVVSFDDAYAAAYIKFDGVDGESKDSQHEKWIDVLAVDWGVISPTNDKGELKGKSSQLVMTITKPIDKATPKLMEATCQGKKCASTTAEFEVCRTVSSSAGTQQCYLKYELQNVLVTSYNMFIMGWESSVIGEEAQPTEQVSLNFEKIKITYTPFDEKGTPGTPVTGFYEKGNKAAGFVASDPDNGDG